MGLRFRQIIGGVAPARRAGVSPTVVMLAGQITPGSAARTVQEIERAKGDIDVMIDSNGGTFGHALEIGAALQRHTGKTTAYALKVESSAVIVMAACGRVVMARDASILLHAASYHDPDGVTLNGMDEAADSLRRCQRMIADICAGRSKSTPSTFWTHLMAANGGQGTRLSPEDCVSYGLADSVSVWPKAYLLRGER